MNRPKVANLADYHQIQNGREVEIGFSLVALYASFTRAPKSVTDLMESKDMILELAPMTTAEIIADAHTDSDTKRIDELASDDMKDIALVILGFLLMIMGKKPAPLQKNWEKYVERRIDSILGAVGISIPPSAVISLLPSHADMIKYHKFIASTHKLRAALTERVIALSQGSGTLKEVFNVVDKNLVWSEMTHVKMIWTYILNHFNEMSNMRTINDGDRALGNMVAFLDMHGSKAAYAKLFVP